MAEELDCSRFDIILGGDPACSRPYIGILIVFPSPPWALFLHCSNRLDNGADGILHFLVAGSLTTGSDVDTVVLRRKGGKDWYGVLVLQ